MLGATSAAATGPEHVTEPVAYDAILLAGFGGPEGQDDVIPFLRNVTRGRGIPEERLEEVAHHYRHFGGVSPINDQNRELKAALEAELASRGIDLPVLWGNRNWDPYLKTRSRGERARSHQAHRDRHERVLLVLELPPVPRGLRDRARGDRPRGHHPDRQGAPVLRPPRLRRRRSSKACATRFAEVSAKVPGIDLATEVELLFTTHSIPSADAAQLRARRTRLRRRRRLRRAAPGRRRGRLARAAPTAVVPWQLVYQSRSGPPSMPWLEPDINDAIAELPATGVRAVVIVPLGFVSDHMEVLWDLDNEAMETVEEHGLVAVRVPTPGTAPRATSRASSTSCSSAATACPSTDRPAMTELGPWYDVCRPGCCENVRLGFKPAAAGLAP